MQSSSIQQITLIQTATSQTDQKSLTFLYYCVELLKQGDKQIFDANNSAPRSKSSHRSSFLDLCKNRATGQLVILCSHVWFIKATKCNFVNLFQSSSKF